MIKRISYLVAANTKPYENLAREAQLLETVAEDECILYLWQNHRTVVIGRNQNCYKECRLEELERDGGTLARRLSGGGAVFHDTGNLNFTFLVQQPNYNVDRQLAVILQAMKKLGISATKSGRNDLTIAERKFSGNAFYHKGKRHYHHGTILINADMQELARYLQVSPAKLKAKGVDSVRSRVANLCDYNSEITVDDVTNALIEAFGEVYDLKPQPIVEKQLDSRRHLELVKIFSDHEWLYGKQIEFTCTYEQRFSWGDIQLNLQIQQSKIIDAVVYSDALDEVFITQIPATLQNCEFLTTAMLERLQVIADTEIKRQMVDDIGKMLVGDGAEGELIGYTI